VCALLELVGQCYLSIYQCVRCLSWSASASGRKELGLVCLRFQLLRTAPHLQLVCLNFQLLRTAPHLQLVSQGTEEAVAVGIHRLDAQTCLFQLRLDAAGLPTAARP
jgi:hypothetical protein